MVRKPLTVVRDLLPLRKSLESNEKKDEKTRDGWIPGVTRKRRRNQENEKENDEWLSNALQKRRMINHKLALENDNL